MKSQCFLPYVVSLPTNLQFLLCLLKSFLAKTVNLTVPFDTVSMKKIQDGKRRISLMKDDKGYTAYL